MYPYLYCQLETHSVFVAMWLFLLFLSVILKSAWHPIFQCYYWRTGGIGKWVSKSCSQVLHDKSCFQVAQEEHGLWDTEANKQSLLHPCFDIAEWDNCLGLVCILSVQTVHSQVCNYEDHNHTTHFSAIWKIISASISLSSGQSWFYLEGSICFILFCLFLNSEQNKFSQISSDWWRNPASIIDFT